MTPGYIREINRLASLRAQLAAAGQGRTGEAIKARLQKAVDAQEELMELIRKPVKPVNNTAKPDKAKSPSKDTVKKS